MFTSWMVSEDDTRAETSALVPPTRVTVIHYNVRGDGG